jgi:RNA polymerase sigma factor (sigma-70 family)
VSPSPVTPSLEQLALVSRIARDVARARRFSTADVQDFVQSVQVRLLERQYEVFAQFQGRSSLHTYLRVVITRLALDWMNKHYGKWRPSAEAARAGGPAPALDRLMNRDGHPAAQAVEILVQRDPTQSVERLTAIAERLPVRARRQFVPEAVLETMATVPFDDPVAAQDDHRARAQLARALRGALRELPPEEWRLLARRYLHGQTVQAIAREVQADPKALYRRFERTLRRLRLALEPHYGQAAARRLS